MAVKWKFPFKLPKKKINLDNGRLREYNYIKKYANITTYKKHVASSKNRVKNQHV